jgi:hypothetical protein
MAGKDKTELSIPRNLKFEVQGRNALARRVPLGRKLKLLRFFSQLIGPVAGGVKAGAAGEPTIPWDSLFAKLPELLDAVDREYKDVIRDCTDLDLAWVDESCEVDDLYTILRKVFEANNLGESMAKLAAQGDAKKKEG